MKQKTVFISYRRKISKHLARSIYQDLRTNGWDVFLDVNTIDSGDFDRIILNQIAARAHFILLISKGSLERCANKGDWVLREIEEAVHLKRNIVPIIEEDANFTQEIAYLPDELNRVIAKKNALPLPHFYFDSAMEKLRNRFLKTPEYVTIRETPSEEKAEVNRRLKQVESEMLNRKPSEANVVRNKEYEMREYPKTNEGSGFLVYAIAGIIGAGIGYFGFNLLGIMNITGFSVINLGTAILGAIILMSILRFVRG